MRRQWVAGLGRRNPLSVLVPRYSFFVSGQVPSQCWNVGMLERKVAGAGMLADRGLATTAGPPACKDGSDHHNLNEPTTAHHSPPYKKRLQPDKRACGSRYLWSAYPGSEGREQGRARVPHLKRLCSGARPPPPASSSATARIIDGRFTMVGAEASIRFQVMSVPEDADLWIAWMRRRSTLEDQGLSKVRLSSAGALNALAAKSEPLHWLEAPCLGLSVNIRRSIPRPHRQVS